MTIWELLLAVLFSSWFVLTVVCQFRQLRLTKWLRRRDVCTLIPLWTFFAPHPGTTDYRLIYRDLEEADGTGEWRELPLYERRRLAHAVWNPRKLRFKVVLDCAQEVGANVRRLGELGVRDEEEVGRRLMVTVPYLLLLNCVAGARESGGPPPPYRQFALVTSEGVRPTGVPQLVLVSPVHPLGTADQVSR